MASRRYLDTIPDFVAINMQSMKTIRKNLGWERGYVAEQVGIHPNTINKYEEDWVLPGKSNYNKLACFFDWEIWE